jgi:hypothetical protein
MVARGSSAKLITGAYLLQALSGGRHDATPMLLVR